MKIPNFYVEPACYEVDFEALRYVRNAVFVEEQRIPTEIEFDDLDRHCHHVLARDLKGRPVGTGRLSEEGRIGRMAVLPEWRGLGVGESILRALIDKARGLGLTRVSAHAQVKALGFYEKSGFSRQGEVFNEVGIPHRTMHLPVRPLADPLRPSPKPRAPSVPSGRLDAAESNRVAILQLIGESSRWLNLYSRELEYGLYGQDDVIEAFKQFALRNRGGGVRIIVQDPASLRGKTHPLLELAQKLTSHFMIRTPVEDEDMQYPSAFVINDRDGYLFRLFGNRYRGTWSPHAPARNRQLQEVFERVWQRSRPCSEFRALGI